MSMKPEEAVLRYLFQDELPEGYTDWLTLFSDIDAEIKPLKYKDVYRVTIEDYSFIVTNKRSQLSGLIKDTLKDVLKNSDLNNGVTVDVLDAIDNIKDSDYVTYVSPELQIEGHYKDYYIYPI